MPRLDEGLPLSRMQKTVQKEVMKATEDLRKNNLALTQALMQYVVAQSRMRDRWAEGDDAVKATLWRDLHSCEEAGRAALKGEGYA
jgi:predicted metal-dependent hydrolase